MRTVIEAKPWLVEPSLVPLPWLEVSYHLERKIPKPLKIGIMWSDGVVNPHSSVTRALSMMKQKLEDVHGVELIDWKPYKHDLAWEIIVSLSFSSTVDTKNRLMAIKGKSLLR